MRKEHPDYKKTTCNIHSIYGWQGHVGYTFKSYKVELKKYIRPYEQYRKIASCFTNPKLKINNEVFFLAV